MSWNRRRRKDQYLLDVKVHTEARTRQRVRWLTAVLTAVAVIGLTGYGTYRLLRWTAAALVFENPRFAIAQITVENDGGMTPAQVTQFAGVRAGQNIFAVDLAQVQRNLELIPMVRRVEVRRMLPSRLHIRVNERVAVARLRPANRELGEGTYFVDRTGVVMKSLKLASGSVLQPQTVGPVPVLTGVTLADVRVGRPVESEQVYRALELLNRLEQTAAGAWMEVEQIDLSKPRHLTVTTKQRMQVRFDVEEFSPQLRRLNAILSWAQQRQKSVATVDLTVSRGVPVTFVN